MAYDFDKLTVRRGTDCYKWDVDAPDSDVIPMWVADMDFEAAPKIVEALRRRVDHAVFGYTKMPQGLHDAVTGWYARRYGCRVEADWLLYTPGVIPALSAIIKTVAGDGGCGVLTQTPAYNHFFSSIRNNRCHLVESKLVAQGDTYVVDFDDFERKAALPETKIFLLCSPHNPVGRVWTEGELRRMAEICKRHGVLVVADEIHSGIIMKPNVFVPFGNVGEEFQDNAVIVSSCTKSFNLAGLQISYIVARDPKLRRAIDRTININEVCDINAFGVVALQTAFNECEDWLGEMCDYVWGNYEVLRRFLAERLPSWGLTRLEATYLAWVDCRSTGLTSEQLGVKLLREARVRVSSGDIYGEPGGFLRLNLAMPRARLVDALRRVAKAMGA